MEIAAWDLLVQILTVTDKATLVLQGATFNLQDIRFQS